MAKIIKIKRGLDIPLKGKADERFVEAKKAQLFGINPDDFNGILPKPVVKVGEKVKTGTVLFCDKKRPEIKIVSPVSGELIAINRGERRKIIDFVIKADQENASENFTKKDIAVLSADETKADLLNSGLWAFIKQRPYDIVANPADTPKAIFVSGFDSSPLAPNYDFMLTGKEEDLQAGFNILAKLTSGKVHVGISSRYVSAELKSIKNVQLTTFDGPHPAGNVGVQIHHIDPINKGEIVWTVNLQDVLMIGCFFNKGILDFTRTVALTGSEVSAPAYYKLIYGSSIENLVENNVTKDIPLRYISGNVLTGTKIEKNGYLGPYDSQISVIPEGSNVHEFLGWISPGCNKFSVSHTFFSWLCPKKYRIDARFRGGKRAFINSNEYDKVFPMNIYPEFLIKATLSKDIEKMENLGIYEVIPEDFALCEFVCTSKIEVQKIIREGLDYMAQELA